ncbi:FecR domain-containing protein [Candidatus Parcubacteria bacterium]|nr:FecR domain-containing protein [Candidatus Parcubacteria bacterium]
MSSRTIFAIVAVLLVAAGIGAYFLFQKPAGVSAAELEVLQGEVEVQPTPQARSLVASAAMSLSATARIKTKAGGKAVVRFKSGSLIRLDENTEIVLAEVAETARASRIQVNLETGQAWARVKQLLETDSFSVTTPNTVAHVRGTAFNARYEAPTTTLLIWKGVVGVAFRDPVTKQINTRLGEVRVGERKSVRLDPETPAVGIRPVDVTVEEVEDPWVASNRAQDRKVDASQGVREEQEQVFGISGQATPTPPTTPAEDQVEKFKLSPTPKVELQAHEPEPSPPKTTTSSKPDVGLPVLPAVPDALEITHDFPEDTVFFPGDSANFSAWLVFSDRRREGATDRVQWAVSSALGTITKEGFAKFNRAGTGAVTASIVIEGKIMRASHAVTVKAVIQPPPPPKGEPPTALPPEQYPGPDTYDQFYQYPR